MPYRNLPFIELPIWSGLGDDFAGTALINPANICACLPDNDGTLASAVRTKVHLVNGQVLTVGATLETIEREAVAASARRH